MGAATPKVKSLHPVTYSLLLNWQLQYNNNIFIFIQAKVLCDLQMYDDLKYYLLSGI